MKVRQWFGVIAALVLASLSFSFAVAQNAPKAGGKEAVLNAAETGKLFPEKVFFRGLVATVQARNSGGVRYADDFLVMAALVDASGYSSGLKEKYQGYVINEVTIEIGGQTLKPGAYGFGFLDGNKLVLMDIAANDVFQVNSVKDEALKRPVPLQVSAGPAAGTYRLYKGRDYVEFKRTK